MVLAMAVMLTNISAATDVYASEPQKISEAEDLSGRELEEREEGKSTKEESEFTEGLQEEQQTTDGIQRRPESAGKMQEKNGIYRRNAGRIRAGRIRNRGICSGSCF